MLGRDVNLGDLALQAGPWIEEDDPAEADHSADLVAHREDDVLATEGRRHGR